MKKTLLVTSLVCSGLALGSLSENAKANNNQPVNTNNNQGQAQINNGNTLVNKQSVALQQPSENDTITILSNFTKDSGISTNQDGINYTVTQQENGYQIELSKNMGQYNHLLAIYNYNPVNHTFSQIGGVFQADTPMGESLKKGNSSQENSKPVNSQQLGLNDVAVWTDQYGINHHVDSDGMDRQTIAGSSQVNYEDWYGAFPDNVVIKNDDTVKHMTRQDYKQYLQSQPQSKQNNQHNSNGLSIKDNQPQSTNNQSSQSNSADLTDSQSNQAKKLPQTGNDINSKAGLGGLALASLTIMFALGKRKEKY